MWIERDESLVELEERPILYSPFLIRVLRRFCSPLLAAGRAIMQPARERKVMAMLKEVNACASRSELEAILGKPQYALKGMYFSRTTPDGDVVVPDYVESYCAIGYVFDVLFFVKQQQCEVFAARRPTAWDMPTR